MADPPVVRDRHVRRGGPEYTTALLNLLPYGPAWSRDPGGVLFQTVRGLANYWGYVDSRAADLLERESDPRKTVELLPDWERNWGLPDPCLKTPQGIAARQLALVMKMTMLGAQSRQFFYDVAARLGYDIHITEHAPYMCGVSHVGDTRGQFNPEDPNQYRWELGPPEIRYYWNVHVANLPWGKFHTGVHETGIDRLLWFKIAEDLECLFQRWKPAHTTIVFDYSDLSGLDFSQNFNSQYIAMGIL